MKYIDKVYERFMPKVNVNIKYFEESFGISPNESNSAKSAKLAKAFKYLSDNLQEFPDLINLIQKYYKFFDKLYTTYNKAYLALYENTDTMSSTQWAELIAVAEKLCIVKVRPVEDSKLELTKPSQSLTEDLSSVKALDKADLKVLFPQFVDCPALDNSVLIANKQIYSFESTLESNYFWYATDETSTSLILGINNSSNRSKIDKELKKEYTDAISTMMAQGIIQPRDIVIPPMVTNAQMLRGTITCKFQVSKQPYTEKLTNKVLANQLASYYLSPKKLKLLSGESVRIIVGVKNDL